jgi:hypothetical protein
MVFFAFNMNDVIMVSPPASYLFLKIADWFWSMLVGFALLSSW